MTRRVVITGMGVLSSIGIGVEEFWQNLISGTSGISDVTRIDTTDFPCHKGGEIKALQIQDYLTPAEIARMGECSQFAVACARLALRNAGVDVQRLAPEKTGVALGTTEGEVQVLQELHDRLFIRNETDRLGELCRKYPTGKISANLAEALGINGYNVMLPNACASGNFAIGYAYDLIKSGKMEYMLAGGADVFSRISFTGFNRLFAVAPDKVQPFDANRQGMMVAEGAGIVFLETLDSALQRGATIYAEIAGYGVSCDAHHMTTPHPEGKGVALSVTRALAEAGIRREEVDYICMHGTGTRANDEAEVKALQLVFGEAAEQIPASSIKSMLGHAMGAASAIETITTALAVKYDLLPPTINLEELDPLCRIDCVPNTARKHPVKVALNNSSAFGGSNACLVLKKADLEGDQDA